MGYFKMKSLFTRRGVFRSLVMAVAIGALGVSAGALAANRTSGGIYGNAQAGATVTVTSESGLTRSTTTGSDGYFKFSALPPGSYTVKEQQNGNVVGTRTVRVNVNSATHVAFAGTSQSLGTIQVVGGAVNPIDVTKTTTGLNLNSTQFDMLPVARNTNAITLLAPTVIPANASLGLNVTSFGGASAAANGYYLNGLNVTDNLNLAAYAHPPFEALQEYQVLTGGLDASFGGALGGILNVVTKSGTNTFHAGVNVYWEPRGLQGNKPNSLVRVPNNPDTDVDESQYLQYYARYADDSYNDLTYNAYASGPIVEDNLFFYAVYQGTKDITDAYSSTQYTHQENSTPQYLAKVDWQINDANLLELTAYDSKHKYKEQRYTLINKNSRWFDKSAGKPLEVKRGGTAYIGKYTWVPTNNFNISGMWGYVTFEQGEDSPTIDCPIAIDETTGVGNRLGCWAQQLYSSPDSYNARHEYRIDGEWDIAGNDITFGYDRQIYYSNVFQQYSGDNAYIYYARTDDGLTTQGGYQIPAGAKTYLSDRTFRTGAEFTNYQHSYYLQDKVHLGNFYFRFGARSLAYSNETVNGTTFIDISDKIAPRLGLSWDVFGDSSLKLFASANQYYMPTSGDINHRLASAELDEYDFYTYTGINSDGSPKGAKKFGGPLYVNGADGTADNPSSIVDHDLTAPHQNEFILGGKYRIPGTQWSLGLRGMRRELKSAVDDTCGVNPVNIWGAFQNHGYQSPVYNYMKQKYGTKVANALPACFTVNPGDDVKTTLLGKDYTIPGGKFHLPDAERYYNAIELSFDRAFDGQWFLHGTLTWSHTYGNEEGNTYSAVGQVDANITEAFDFPGIMAYGYGNLANDRTWTLKLFGAYQISQQWRIGFNAQYYSGAALSCLGTYAGDIPSAGANLYGADTHFCYGKPAPLGGEGNGPRIVNIGSSIHYLPTWAPGLKLSVAFLNMFNFHGATGVNQYGELDNGKRNPAFLAPIDYQDQRAVRFAVEYDFL
jgi:hypothetical protein